MLATIYGFYKRRTLEYIYMYVLSSFNVLYVLVVTRTVALVSRDARTASTRTLQHLQPSVVDSVPSSVTWLYRQTCRRPAQGAVEHNSKTGPLWTHPSKVAELMLLSSIHICVSALFISGTIRCVRYGSYQCLVLVQYGRRRVIVKMCSL